MENSRRDGSVKWIPVQASMQNKVEVGTSDGSKDQGDVTTAACCRHKFGGVGKGSCRRVFSVWINT